MPTFFNRKENVIDIKLTRYGRYLLSMGTFKPEYYAFYDDDIIYESQYGGHPPITGSSYTPELQNSISGRIKETPRLKTQTVFGGAETEVTELNEHIRSGLLTLGYGGLVYNNEKYTLQDKDLYNLLSPKLQQNIEKTMISAAPMGRSALGGRYRPSWDIRAYKTPISSSITFYTGSSDQIVPIPQLEMDHIIHTYFQDEGADFFNGDFPADEDAGEPTVNPIGLVPASELDVTDGTLATPVYTDGTYITQKQEYVFLDVVERNVDPSRENFDIEVFEIERDPNGVETMRPLSFLASKDNLTLLTPEGILNENFSVIDNSYVEYYFNVDVDGEIDDSILCDIDLRSKKHNYFVDYQIEYTCPDEEAIRTYTTSVVDPFDPNDPEEVC